MDIRRTIRERGLFSKDIAEILGISQVAMSNRINGNPRLSTLKAIAEAIGCSICDFFYPDEGEEADGEDVKFTLDDEQQTDGENTGSEDAICDDEADDGKKQTNGTTEVKPVSVRQNSPSRNLGGAAQTSHTEIVCPHCGRRMHAVVVTLS